MSGGSQCVLPSQLVRVRIGVSTRVKIGVRVMGLRLRIKVRIRLAIATRLRLLGMVLWPLDKLTCVRFGEKLIVNCCVNLFVFWTTE